MFRNGRDIAPGKTYICKKGCFVGKNRSKSMRLTQKIRLSGRYGRIYYVVAGIIDVACAVFILLDPLTTPMVFLVKVMSIPVLAYLFFALASNEKMFFYLNLGFSRNEYRYIPIVIDALAFVLLVILSIILSHVIFPA